MMSDTQEKAEILGNSQSISFGGSITHAPQINNDNVVARPGKTPSVLCLLTHCTVAYFEVKPKVRLSIAHYCVNKRDVSQPQGITRDKSPNLL